VASVCSGMVWAGTQVVDGSVRSEPPAAWTLHGQRVPYLTPDAGAVDWSHSPVALRPSALAALQDEQAIARAKFPLSAPADPSC
jgi:hypothetical protein